MTVNALAITAAVTLVAAPPLEAWTANAHEYLEASRAYFAGESSATGAERIARARRRLEGSIPSDAHLSAALTTNDGALPALAIAALSVSKRSDPELVRLALERIPAEQEWFVRLLAVEALRKTDGQWTRRNGRLVLDAFGREANANVTIPLATGVVCLLDPDDALALATALVVNGEHVTRKATWLALCECRGTGALRGVAERLRRLGRTGAADEAQAEAAQREHDAPGAR